MKGSYVLILEMDRDSYIQIGKLGKIYFRKGYYAYVGSAMNGIERRVSRHLSDDKKKLHWHIDYLLRFANIVDVFYKESNRKEECRIAKEFSKKFTSIYGFGSSDCRCRSHLFFSQRRRGLYDLSMCLGMIIYKKN